MHIKKLTIKGFKSFANPVTFVFERGITCIVGPNGSGKSNVVDALAWVLGQQGVRSLRGDKMDDLIFAGTSTRGPLGRAEVEVTFENIDGTLLSEYSEVTVSRTLFRNGASQYAINSQNCRLLDLQELLSETGLGRQMHVIVGQGQLDDILKSTVDDRRAFIEEAAGIYKHRQRKEKTLRKLESMQTNLTRLSDIAEEVEKQLIPLKKQVKLAQKSREYSDRYKEALGYLFSHEMNTVLKHEKTLDRQYMDAEKIHIQRELEYTDVQKKRIAYEKNDLQYTYDHAQRTVLEMSESLKKMEMLLALATQRVAFVSDQGDSLKRVDIISAEEIKNEAKKYEHYEQEVERLNQMIIRQRKVLEQAQQHHHDQQRIFLDLKEKRSAYDQACLAQKNRVDLAFQACHSFQKEQEHIETQRPTQMIQYADLLERLSQSVFFIQVTHETVAVVKRLRDEKRVFLELLSGKKEKMVQVRNELEQQLRAVDARLETLSLLLDDKDAAHEIVKAKQFQSVGYVAENIYIEPGYEKAISVALGDVAQAVTVSTPERVIEIVQYVRQESLGHIALVSLDTVAGRDSKEEQLYSQEILDLVQKHVVASSVVRAHANIIGELEATYIVDTFETASSLWQILCSLDVQHQIRLVTLEGDLLTPHVVYVGSQAQTTRIELVSKRKSALLMQQDIQSEIVQIEKDDKRLQEHFDHITNELNDLEEQVCKAELAQHQGDQKVRELESHVAFTRNQHIQRKNETQQWHERFAQLEEEYQRQQHVYEELCNIAPAQPDDTYAHQAKKRLEEERSVEAKIYVEYQIIQEKYALQKQHYENRMLAQQQQREHMLHEERIRIKLTQEHQRTMVVLQALEPLMRSAQRSMDQAKYLADDLTQRMQQQRQEVSRLREREDVLMKQVRECSERAHRYELLKRNNDIQRTQIREQVYGQLGISQEQLLSEYERIGGDQIERYKHQRDQAQQGLKKLGTINPLAAEECDALQNRYAFLQEQLIDLANTRQDLLKIMNDLDAHMQDVFVKAFEDVKRSFHQMFPILFPGGQGDLFLTDPENIATTGVDISIRPVGKKIERLSLLSGGERALAAVAFLLAIFHARPSPFYIMDEVESALDDGNLQRLLDAFQQLQAESQLIVITHQKRTMEIANTLYGVTMRKDGVSTVVSQRVDVE